MGGGGRDLLCARKSSVSDEDLASDAPSSATSDAPSAFAERLRCARRGSCPCRAFAVKVAPTRLPVFPFSGFDLYHHFRNDAFYGIYNLLKVQKTGKREVVLGQPLPQTLYFIEFRVGAETSLEKV